MGIRNSLNFGLAASLHASHRLLNIKKASNMIINSGCKTPALAAGRPNLIDCGGTGNVSRSIASTEHICSLREVPKAPHSESQ